MINFNEVVEESRIERLNDGGAFIGAVHFDKESFENFLKQQEALKNPEKESRGFTRSLHAYPFSCPPPTSTPRVFPGFPVQWSSVGEFNSQGDTWKHDAAIQATGDPTASPDSANAKIGLTTGASHDVNAFWGVESSSMSRGQTGVRGVYFETEQIGDTNFNPRISGSAMVWKNSNGDRKIESLSFDGADRAHTHSGTIENLTTSWKSYWGLSKKDDAWFKWADSNYYWAGVIFHFESTWKTGSSRDSMVRIRNLRPILDRDFNEKPNNDVHGPYAVWGNFS